MGAEVVEAGLISGASREGGTQVRHESLQGPLNVGVI